VWRDVSGIIDLEHTASPRLFGRERCVDDRRSVEPGRVDRKRGQSSLEANKRRFVQRLREEFGAVLVEIEIEGLIEPFKHVDAGSEAAAAVDLTPLLDSCRPKVRVYDTSDGALLSVPEQIFWKTG
jgi:hypothetical protein